MRVSLVLFLVITGMAGAAVADDLYYIPFRSHQDAAVVSSDDFTPIMRLGNSYLVLVRDRQTQDLLSTIPDARLLTPNVTRAELAILRHTDRIDAAEYPVIFSENDIHVIRARPDRFQKTDFLPAPLPLPERQLEVFYKEPSVYNRSFAPDSVGLDSLISLVSQDSLESYLYRLEAFYRRLTGTDSAYAAADWIAGKFAEFGYDSIVIDTFIGSQLWDRIPVESRNVIATKVGSRFPDRIIVVGAHFDAVPDCPGADDNGSGTAGVMEIARVLKDIETEMTFKFIAFDSEESWMWGSYDYADSVAAIGENIVYMQNLDMIGHLPNSDKADLYYGAENAYAQLWIDLAKPLVGIQGYLSGYTASDHVPFLDNGYDATFVQERIFSSHYHQPSDSTTYINFEYMTRMVKASLATDYTVNFALAPVKITAIYDVGDGHSLMLEWPPALPGEVDYFVIHYGPNPNLYTDSTQIPGDSSRYIISGLAEGQTYIFAIVPHSSGRQTFTVRTATGTPYSRPATPQSLKAIPQIHAIRLDWSANNTELDFSHYQVLRDGISLPDSINDFFYIDDDPALGDDFHYYRVLAFDTDGNSSDTLAQDSVRSKAATLQPGRVLAVNRTSNSSLAMIDEVKSGELMREALTGLNYDYFSDTSFQNPNRADLFNLIDYELVVISAEGARTDELSTDPMQDGFETYLSIGGKAVFLSRRGNLSATFDDFDTVLYNPGSSGPLYYNKLHTSGVIRPMTVLGATTYTFHSDFVGAHSQLPEYPDLVWDSALTAYHANAPGFGFSGIPCPALPMMRESGYDIIYTYDSSTDSIPTEGKPIGWRYLGEDYQYVAFEIPLSLMEHSSAVTALRQAVNDLGLVSSAEDDYPAAAPRRFELYQNYPNPFNLQTAIEFVNPGSRAAFVSLEIFNILGQKVRTLVEGPVAPGRHRLLWDGRDNHDGELATGVYLYRLKTDTDILTRKMLLLK